MSCTPRCTPAQHWALQLRRRSQAFPSSRSLQGCRQPAPRPWQLATAVTILQHGTHRCWRVPSCSRRTQTCTARGRRLCSGWIGAPGRARTGRRSASSAAVALPPVARRGTCGSARGPPGVMQALSPSTNAANKVRHCLDAEARNLPGQDVEARAVGQASAKRLLPLQTTVLLRSLRTPEPQPDRPRPAAGSHFRRLREDRTGAWPGGEAWGQGVPRGAARWPLALPLPRRRLNAVPHSLRAATLPAVRQQSRCHGGAPAWQGALRW